MKRVSLEELLQKDFMLIAFYSLISLFIGSLFIQKHFGLSPDSFGYIDIAENIVRGNGFVLHGGSYLSNTLIHPLSEWMPLYPLFISFFIKIGLDSTLSARLVPVIFLALIPFPMYYLAKGLYGRTIAHASTIYLIFLWALIYCGSYAWTETAFIFFTLVSILFLSQLEIPSSDKSVTARSNIISFLSGIFIGFAYLTKGNGVLLIPIAFFAIFFLISPIRNKIKCLLLLLIGFSLVSSLWWIRNYFIFSNPLYYGQSSLFHIPTLQSFLHFPYVYGIGLFPLVLCLPYSLRYIFNMNERKKFLLLASYPVIMTLFFSGWVYYDMRLLSPTFPFLIIIGMKSLFDIVEWIKGRLSKLNIFSSKRLIIALLILFIMPQVIFDISYYFYGTPNFLNHTHEKSVLEKMGAYKSIDWIKTNTNHDDVILSDVPSGLYYYTKRNVVWTGGGPYTKQLNYSSFMDAVSRLNISYVVLFKEHTNREYSGDFVYNLSQGCNVPSNLDIVYDKGDAIIYRVKGDKTLNNASNLSNLRYKSTKTH